jgi:hypothetical protein
VHLAFCKKQSKKRSHPQVSSNDEDSETEDDNGGWLQPGRPV